MKVAIVGVGNMGRHYVKKFEILGFDAVLIDLNEQLLAKYSDTFKKYTNLDEALKKEEITHMFIATDPNSHIPLAKKAINNGINVMIEKPPALKASVLEDAIDLANQKGVFLAVSEIELRSNCVRNFDNTQPVEYIEAYRLNLGSGYINPFYDLAWHDIYILQYLFKSIKLKKVVEKQNRFEIVGETSSNEFYLEVAWNNEYLKRQWELKTKNGNIIFDFVNDTIIYPSGEKIEKDGKDKLEMMITEFIQKPSFESSHRALEILKEFEKF